MLYLTNRFHLAVCLSVIDHRWRQNVVRSEKWPTSRYNWTDARPNGIYLFYIIKKQKLIKAFLFRKKIQSRAVMGFSNSEKSDLTSFVIYTNMEQTDWLLGPATNCDWLRKSRHCQNLIEKFAFRGTKHHSESSNSIRKSWNVLQNTAKI